MTRASPRSAGRVSSSALMVNLIHPKTIAAANAHFGPDSQAVAWAERIIAAHGAALDAGQGMAVVDGKLIENLHIAEAERTLALAAAIAARVG